MVWWLKIIGKGSPTIKPPVTRSPTEKPKHKGTTRQPEMKPKTKEEPEEKTVTIPNRLNDPDIAIKQISSMYTADAERDQIMRDLKNRFLNIDDKIEENNDNKLDIRG